MTSAVVMFCEMCRIFLKSIKNKLISLFRFMEFLLLWRGRERHPVNDPHQGSNLSTRVPRS
ncbi:MAG: hypothetical protein AAAB16_25830, partial [Pseudomonas sp.]|uniref:hypothetical protein n=1 Tax=Pseudomonas sp. TaxID=306 RepID=UPI0030F04F02